MAKVNAAKEKARPVLLRVTSWAYGAATMDGEKSNGETNHGEAPTSGRFQP